MLSHTACTHRSTSTMLWLRTLSSRWTKHSQRQAILQVMLRFINPSPNLVSAWMCMYVWCMRASVWRSCVVRCVKRSIHVCEGWGEVRCRISMLLCEPLCGNTFFLIFIRCTWHCNTSSKLPIVYSVSVCICAMRVWMNIFERASMTVHLIGMETHF